MRIQAAAAHRAQRTIEKSVDRILSCHRHSHVDNIKCLQVLACSGIGFRTSQDCVTSCCATLTSVPQCGTNPCFNRACSLDQNQVRARSLECVTFARRMGGFQCQINLGSRGSGNRMVSEASRTCLNNTFRQAAMKLHPVSNYSNGQHSQRSPPGALAASERPGSRGFRLRPLRRSLCVGDA